MVIEKITEELIVSIDKDDNFMCTRSSVSSSVCVWNVIYKKSYHWWVVSIIKEIDGAAYLMLGVLKYKQDRTTRFKFELSDPKMFETARKAIMMHIKILSKGEPWH